MPPFPRQEMEEMVGRWLSTNRRCEETGDWKPLADMYTSQRTLRLADGPDEVHHMVVGRAEIARYQPR